MTSVRETAPDPAVDAGVEAFVRRPWHQLIGGELVPAADGATMDVVDPARDEIVTTAPEGGPADVDLAVAAAVDALPAWRAASAAARAAVLRAVADRLEAHGEELAWIDTIDNGTPIRVMRSDYRLAVEHLRAVAGLALQIRGETLPVDERDAVDLTLRDPFGVVGRIVPFNHPLMFAAARIAAPLLAGNTVVLKPSEQTSLSALRMAELVADLVPAGVLNVVTGPGATVGERLVEHPDVPRIAFTGGVEVGRRIQQVAARSRVKTVTLELGGKNPLIVFPDADLDAAVDGAVRGMNFTWQGQSCGSTSRVYAHRSVYDRVVEGLAARMSALVVGDPRSDADRRRCAGLAAALRPRRRASSPARSTRPASGSSRAGCPPRTGGRPASSSPRPCSPSSRASTPTSSRRRSSDRCSPSCRSTATTTCCARPTSCRSG